MMSAPAVSWYAMVPAEFVMWGDGNKMIVSAYQGLPRKRIKLILG